MRSYLHFWWSWWWWWWWQWWRTLSHTDAQKPIYGIKCLWEFGCTPSSSSSSSSNITITNSRHSKSISQKRGMRIFGVCIFKDQNTCGGVLAIRNTHLIELNKIPRVSDLFYESFRWIRKTRSFYRVKILALQERGICDWWRFSINARWKSESDDSKYSWKMLKSGLPEKVKVMMESFHWKGPFLGRLNIDRLGSGLEGIILFPNLP